MIVLDTHVLLWFGQGDAKLGRKAAALIESEARDDTVQVPAFCAWEIAMAERGARIVLPGGALTWFERILRSAGFEVAGLVPLIAVESARLEWEHRDPADRIIVATARHLSVPLLTADKKILAYAAAGHVRAIDARR